MANFSGDGFEVNLSVNTDAVQGAQNFDKLTQSVEGTLITVKTLTQALKELDIVSASYTRLLNARADNQGGRLSTQQAFDIARGMELPAPVMTRISGTLSEFDKSDAALRAFTDTINRRRAAMEAGGKAYNPELVFSDLDRFLGKGFRSSDQVNTAYSQSRGLLESSLSHTQSDRQQQEFDSVGKQIIDAQKQRLAFMRSMDRDQASIRRSIEQEAQEHRKIQETLAEYQQRLRATSIGWAQRDQARDSSAAQFAEDKAARMLAPNSAALLGVERDIKMRGMTDPVERSRIANAYSAMINAQQGDSNASPALMMRGLAQMAIGSGVANFRLYSLFNGVQSLAKGSGMGGMLGLGGPGGGGGAAGVAGAEGAGAGGGGLLGSISSAGMLAGTVVGIGALAAAQIAAANSAAQHVRELRNLGEQLGTTTQGARQLEGAARISGVSIDAIGAGMRQLTQGVEESFGRGAGANSVLQSIGVSPTTSGGTLKDTRDLMIDISKALQGKGDMESRDVLERLFGRGGRQLLPLMKQNLDGLLKSVDALNGGFNDKQALQYAEGMAKVGLMFDSLKEKFATPLFWVVEMIDNTKKGKFWSEVFSNAGAGELDTASGGVSDAPSVMPGWMRNQQNLSTLSAVAVQSRNRSKLDATPEGLRKLISQTEQGYTQALNVANRPPGLDDNDSTMQSKWNEVNRQGTLLEQQKAQLKAMEAKDPNIGYLRGLQRQADRAGERDLDGYARNNQTAADRTEEAGARKMPSAEYAEALRQINKMHVAEDILTSKVMIRTRVTAEARIAMQGATFDIQQNRALAVAAGASRRIGGSQKDNVAGNYSAAIDLAQDNYDIGNHAIGIMQADLDSDPDDPKANSLRMEIAEKRRQNSMSLANATTIAGSNAVEQYTRIALKAAAAQMRFNEALEKGAVDSNNLAVSISSQQIVAGIQQTGGLEQARLAGVPGSGAQIANVQLSTRLKSIAQQRTTLDQNRTESLSRMSGELGAIGVDPLINEDVRLDRQRTKILQIHNEEMSYEREKAKLQSEVQDAYFNRAKSAVELEVQHLEAIRSLAGSVFDAATTPGRGGAVNALEKLGVSTGKSIGRTIFGNIATTAVGRVIHPGALEIPGQVEIDPATGKAKQDGNSNDKLTALGKILQGTPFGHHQKAPIEVKVENIDKTASKMLDDLDAMLQIMTAGTPTLPGGTVNIPGVSLPGRSGSPVASTGNGGALGILSTLLGAVASVGASGGTGGLSSGLGFLGGAGGGTAGLGTSSGGFGSLISLLGGLGGGIGSIGGGGGSSSSGGFSSILNTLGFGGGLFGDKSGLFGGGVFGSLFGHNSSSDGALNYTTDAMGNLTLQSGGASGGLGNGSIFSGLPGGIGGSGSSGGAAGAGGVGGSLGSKISLSKGVNGANIALAATGALTAIGGIRQGGAKGIATAIGGGLETAGAIAAMIPGGQLIGGALALAGAATSAIAQLVGGNSRADREYQLNQYAATNRWTAPAAYNLATTTNGQSATYDVTGAPRGFNGPLLAYPNTSSYTQAYDYTFNRNNGGQVPAGQSTLGSTQLPIQASNPVTVPGPVFHFNLLDGASIMDRAHDIASAVSSAMSGGHRGMEAAVQDVANKL